MLREREVVLGRLRDEYARGRLSDDSLELRVAETLRADSFLALDDPLWDLPAARWDGVTTRWEALQRWVRDEPAGLRLEDGRWLASAAPRAAWTVGRSRSCDARVSEASVSRRHALISQRGGRWAVRDLGSVNGTWLNGRRVEQATLRRGDELRLGRLTARLS